MSEKITQKEPYEISLPVELSQELQDVKQAGYEISVGEARDEAYAQPEQIEHMFQHLDALGNIYEMMAKYDRPLRVAGAALYQQAIVPPALRRIVKPVYKRREEYLEAIRSELLFDATKMPWHLQRGNAVALQTIVDAHQLQTEEDTEDAHPYKTMAGSLTLEPQQTIFSETDGRLAWMSLREAIVHTGQTFYGKSEAVAGRYADTALSSLQGFLAAPVTKDFRDIVAYCQDSLGIRSRKQEVCQAISDHVDGVLERTPSKEHMVLLSTGCGTAQSILEVAKDIKQKGLRQTVILVDQDPIALAAAKNIAESMGLADSLEIHCERLFDAKGRPFDMTRVLRGRKIDVAEDSGLREYLPNTIYCNLSRTTWEHLEEDGMMTTGNMNKNRPQPEFLHGLMGWNPPVMMRHIADGLRLHEQSGVPKGNTKVRVTPDGVYSLFYSYKTM